MVKILQNFRRTAATKQNTGRENKIPHWHLTRLRLAIPVSKKTTRTLGLHADHATNSLYMHLTGTSTILALGKQLL